MSPDRLLVRRISAIGEPQQRVAVLAEELERVGARAFVELLALVVARAAERKGAGEQATLGATIDFLSSSLVTDEVKLVLLDAAREGGFQEILDLLVAPPPQRVADSHRVPDYGSGRLLTLGERKALARRPNRQVLEQVMADPHPAVIKNLLRNAKLTEADVLRLASRRPNHDVVLTEVYASKRWISRYAIKVALVRNPYTPPAVALKLLPLLFRQDVAEISHALELHPSVILACRRIVVGGPTATKDDDGTDMEPGPTVH